MYLMLDLFLMMSAPRFMIYDTDKEKEERKESRNSTDTNLC